MLGSVPVVLAKQFVPSTESKRACAQRTELLPSSRLSVFEYAAETETEVEYRGHKGKLWKRPYGALYEALGLTLRDHGPAEGFDACEFWLLEKDAEAYAAAEKEQAA